MTLRETLAKKELKEVRKFDVLTVIYRDIFHMKDLYEMMHEWVLEEGFTDDNGDGKDAFETFYWERRKPGTTGKDFIIWWRLRKDINAWWTYLLNIEFVGIHVENTEIMYEGHKLKLNKGEIDIFISPICVLDISGMWKGGTIFDSFIKPFRLRMIKKDASWHKREIEDYASRLQMTIKDFLDLKQFEHRGQPLHGTKGLDWD